MNREKFEQLLQPILNTVGNHPVDKKLETLLDTRFPHDGEVFGQIESACHAAIADGWMCTQGGAGRRFGRVVEPADSTFQLSVDVVDLENVVGPHHRHPNGEVCMVMPVRGEPRFDGHARGWCVFEPGSSHFPTVQGGRALVLYMLPKGEIEFSGQSPG